MAWLAFDRAIALSNHFGLAGPVQRWEQIRAQIHDQILERAYDPQRHTFTQSYGFTALDAGALMVGLVGLLEPTDDRFTEFHRRGPPSSSATMVSYRATRPTPPTTACPAAEGQFLACSFWLVEALALNGREDEARELFERLLALRNNWACTPRSTVRSPWPAGVRQLPAGVHPPRPDRRRPGPQRRADRPDPPRPRRCRACRRHHAGQLPWGCAATIAACPVSSCLVPIAGFLLPANDTPRDDRRHSDDDRHPGTHLLPSMARLACPRHAACHYRAHCRADRRCCSPAVRDLGAGTNAAARTPPRSPSSWPSGRS